jgi:hypothetical protein
VTGVQTCALPISPLEKARALAQALKAARTYDALEARRRVVDGGAAALSAGAGSGELAAQLESVLSGLRIAVIVDEIPGGRLRTTIASTLGDLGFSVIDRRTTPIKGAAAFLSAAMTLEPLDRGHPQWKFCQWRGTLELNGSEGTSVASAAPDGSEGHLSEATALDKARTAGEQEMAREAGRLVSRYIFGE